MLTVCRFKYTRGWYYLLFLKSRISVYPLPKEIITRIQPALIVTATLFAIHTDRNLPKPEKNEVRQPTAVETETLYKRVAILASFTNVSISHVQK